MRVFGKKAEFGIDYHNYIDQFPDHPDVIADPDKYERGGNVYFWVTNKNLFLYKGYGPDGTYEADLNILLEFFCENLWLLITDDPFPVETKSKNAVDMMDETNLVQGDDSDLSKWLDVDWDNVDMEVRTRMDIWNQNHGMLYNRDGSFLPDLFIRKVRNNVEISWNNKYPHRNAQGEIYFEYEKGVDYVDLKLFKETVVAFCLDLINRFQKNYPEQMNRYRAALQKAIDVPV